MGLHVDPALAGSLSALLRERARSAGAPPDEAARALELAGALDELASGAADALLLEAGGQDDGAPAAPDRGVVRCGDLVIDPRSRTVTRGGAEVSLTPKEFDILHFLARNRGEVLTKEQIYRAVWEDDYLLDASNVMAFIRKLRKKVEPNPDAPVYIQTIWGVGYRFAD